MQPSNKVCNKYVVWSRKYRPTRIGELVGQDVLTKVLNYSMIYNQLAHAYLLSGIQGIGKTTTARIIAKTINCLQPIIQEQSIIACDKCNSCNAFVRQNHPDVNEIDAASNTGVDNIREIIENSEYIPLLGKYKVFIIDEVHMLSKSAFNALLKLLEEPPRHTIFIFATTEINKIPLTVISRCQRFNLQRLDHSNIICILNNIAAKEQIKVSNEALELIAIKSEGAARDAISLLEQAHILSLASHATTDANIQPLEIDFAIVEAMCSINLPIIVELLKAIVEQNVNVAMRIINNVHKEGGNFVNISEGIIDLIGCIIKLKAVDNYKEYTYASHSSTLEMISAKANIARLTVLWQIFNKAILELRTTHNIKLSFEVNVIKAIYSFSLPTPSAALKQIQDSDIGKKIENTVQSTATPTAQHVHNEYSINVGQIHSGNNNNETCYVDSGPSDVGRNVYKSQVSSSTAYNDDIAVMVDFLRYLQQKKEIDLYYYLMNKISIIKIEDHHIYLSSNNSDEKLNRELVKHLKQWRDANWLVSTLDKVDQVTFKSRLLKYFQCSEEWKLLLTKFKDAEISDIITNINNH